MIRKILLILAITSAALACNGKKNYESVNAEQFATAIATQKPQIIDARTPEEFQQGHIPGAQNIDVKSSDFDTLISTLDKSRPVAVYCRSGRRSKMAAERLVSAGFNVVELDGGILSWEGEIAK